MSSTPTKLPTDSSRGLPRSNSGSDLKDAPVASTQRSAGATTSFAVDNANIDTKDSTYTIQDMSKPATGLPPPGSVKSKKIKDDEPGKDGEKLLLGVGLAISVALFPMGLAIAAMMYMGHRLGKRIKVINEKN